MEDINIENVSKRQTIAVAIIMVTIIGLIATPQSAFAGVSQTDAAGIYDGRLILLDEPTTDGAPLLSYFPGAPIEVLSYMLENGNDQFWARVRIGFGRGSIEGWVYNSALKWYNSCTSSLPSAYVDTATMDLTADLQPGNPIRTCTEGTEVKILGRGIANNIMWEHVLVGGEIGFMNGAFLKHDSDYLYEKNAYGLTIGDKALVNSISGTQAIIKDSPIDEGNIIGKLYNGTDVRIYDTVVLDGWICVAIGELSSGFAVGSMRIEDLAFGDDRSNVISCIPTQAATSVLSLHVRPELDLTGILSDAMYLEPSPILYWIDAGDNYEILGEWNTQLFNPSWNDDHKEILVKYTAPNGDTLTGYAAL
ncbi:MAG: hypothetical protein LBS72_09350 [Oscillospiraceae bacterium]|nr:hypothetical protein [Oscillospiraceae bacterium]